MSRGLVFMMLAGLTTMPLFAVKPTVAGAPVSDDFFTRLEAVALVQTLNGEILASRSATLTLAKWCNEHGLAGISDANSALWSGYRHVQLMCGDQILSEADNWYVPSRLTADMNRVLETTATPFGKAL